MKTKEPVDNIIGPIGAFAGGMVVTLMFAIAVMFVLVLIWGVIDFFFHPSTPMTLPYVFFFVFCHSLSHLRVAHNLGTRSRSVIMPYALACGVYASWLLLALACFSGRNILFSGGNSVVGVLLAVYGALPAVVSYSAAVNGMRSPAWRLKNICPACGYSLENLPQPGCPECGHDRPPATNTPNTP
ncbi:MAG: hypothetical protein EA376_08240 [Phycisphaeraceae bacterium]|nr:MAG: hypothetical protein EA376_08240 [Phycisphaeraceae bacterium]